LITNEATKGIQMFIKTPADTTEARTELSFFVDFTWPAIKSTESKFMNRWNKNDQTVNKIRKTFQNPCEKREKEFFGDLS
jgi:hypothetical protein